MHKRSPKDGFSIVEMLLAVIVFAAIAACSWLAWHHAHEKKAASTGKTASQQTKSASTSSSKSAAATTDPYAGWKSASLSYERASIKYPASWTVANSSTAGGQGDSLDPGSDQLKITSPSGMLVTVNTGVIGIGDGFSNVLSSKALKTLGNSYFLDFYTNDSSNSALAQGACIGTSGNSNASYPFSANISVDNGDGAKSYNVVCLSYPEDQNGNVPEKSVAAFEADPSFGDALLAIESLAYSTSS